MSDINNSINHLQQLVAIIQKKYDYIAESNGVNFNFL